MNGVHAIELQRHLGVHSFLVLGGQHHARQVFCRAWTKSVYEELWLNGTLAGHTRESFERHVLGEVGLVHDGARLVDEATMLAVWQALQPSRERSPERYVTSVALGYFDPVFGWIRSTVEAIPVPVAIELPPEEWPDELGSVRPASLALRHLQQMEAGTPSGESRP